MEEQSKPIQSVWGKWWMPVRKWFYPTWLTYEASYRFYDYSATVYHYIATQQKSISPFIGTLGTKVLGTISCLATFVICTLFLTIPASYLLYNFLDGKKTTTKRFEQQLKRIL
jgi:hypothetical protein